MKLLQKDGDSRKNLMMLCLVAAGVMEFLFITLENLFGGLGYYLTETYLVVPALLFLGCALGGQLTKFAGKRLVLAGAAICWFVLVQIIHKLSGMDTHPIATVFFVYLMAFPFASASDDSDNAGIRWIGGMFVTASLVLVGYTGLLLVEIVPESLKQYLYWDGARLHAFWHPNVAASYFMLGIGFSLVFCVRARKQLAKILLLAAVVVQIAAMALTNCRTTLLMTGAMLGGTIFLMIVKKIGINAFRERNKIWKILLIFVVSVLVILIGTFKLSGVLYRENNERLIMELQAETGDVPWENTEEILQGDNGQGTLVNDMRTLNGRTYIWSAAMNAVRDSKSIALFGTEYSGLAISVYNKFDVVHGHNSWVEALMRMGLPGLLISLVFTGLSVWSAAKLLLSSAVPLWKKIIAMLTLCVMAAGFLEPYLFITNVYYHVTDFAFFFLTGYLDYWANAPRQETA